MHGQGFDVGSSSDRSEALNDLGALKRATYPMASVRIALAVQDGETVSVGDDVYEFDTDGAVTSGNILADCTGGSEVSAQGTFTVATGQNAANGDTVTIDSKMYTFETTLTDVDGNVLIGANATASALNLTNAIMLGSGAGGTYAASMTEHPTCTAVASGETSVVTSKTPGTAGNAIASTETGAQLSFGSTTLGDTTAGVDPTAGEASDALIAAINASGTEEVTAIDISANEVLLTHGHAGALFNTLPLAETMAGANNAVDSTFRDGVDSSVPKMLYLSRVPTAQEVSLGTLHVLPGFVPTQVFVSCVTTSTGALVVWDGVFTIDKTTGLVTLGNGGSTDWSVNETVNVLFLG